MASGPFDDVPLPNVEVTAMVRRGIKISPLNALTDKNGQATFTITAKKKGNSKVTFKAGDVKKSIIVKVK